MLIRGNITENQIQFLHFKVPIPLGCVRSAQQSVVMSDHSHIVNMLNVMESLFSRCFLTVFNYYFNYYSLCNLQFFSLVFV